MFRITLNQPAVELFPNGGITFRHRDGKLEVRATATSDENMGSLKPRGRGGAELETDENILNEMKNSLRNPHSKYFLLFEEDDGWYTVIPYNPRGDRGDPPRTKPHLRIWGVPATEQKNKNKVAINQPRPRRKNRKIDSHNKPNDVKIDLTLTEKPPELVTRYLRQLQRDTVMLASRGKRPGRPPTEVTAAKARRVDFLRRIREMGIGISDSSPMIGGDVENIVAEVGDLLRRSVPRMSVGSAKSTGRKRAPYVSADDATEDSIPQSSGLSSSEERHSANN